MYHRPPCALGKFASSKSTRTEGCIQSLTLGLRKSSTGEDVMSCATGCLLCGLRYGCRTHTWSWKDSYLDRRSMFCIGSTAVSSTGRGVLKERSNLSEKIGRYFLILLKKDHLFLNFWQSCQFFGSFIENHEMENHLKQNLHFVGFMLIFHGVPIFFKTGTKWKQLPPRITLWNLWVFDFKRCMGFLWSCG